MFVHPYRKQFANHKASNLPEMSMFGANLISINDPGSLAIARRRVGKASVVMD